MGRSEYILSNNCGLKNFWENILMLMKDQKRAFRVWSSCVIVDCEKIGTFFLINNPNHSNFQTGSTTCIWSHTDVTAILSSRVSLGSKSISFEYNVFLEGRFVVGKINVGAKTNSLDFFCSKKLFLQRMMGNVFKVASSAGNFCCSVRYPKLFCDVGCAEQ